MIGQTIAHYRVTAKIGAGGMGEVYRATDTKLGRDVALKVLPADRLFSEDARARLVNEARTASSLNHPNICTIHEVGETGEQLYIAMEFVEGKPLNAVVPRGGLAADLVLRYGRDVAAALEHAHERHVIHRDLKASNVAITPRGGVKVLDFGLAKRLAGQELDEATRSRLTLTEAGGIVGTLQYMSPEVLRGDTADERSDIWALGVLLYDMAAGELPFKGKSSFETSSAILREPMPALAASVPAGLRGVIERCLAKEPGQRYQRACEVRAALEAIHSGASHAPAPAVRRWQWSLLYTGVALLAIGVVIAGIVLFGGKSSRPAPAAEWVQVTNFTDSATSPALSPDGRMVAFKRGPSTFGGPGQIYVKLLPNGDPAELTHDGLSKMSPVFSPDGSRIAYTGIASVWAWDTWTVPVLGGEPRRMLPNASGLTWMATPSGERRILFSEIKRGVHMAIVSAGESRAGARDVYDPPAESGMAHRSYLSPDRNWVLLAEMDISGWLPCRVVPFDGSSRGKQVGPPAAQCTHGAWSPDGKWMYFSANLGAGFHIWRQRFANGAGDSAAEQITFGPTEEEGIALEPGGRSLISSVGATQSSVWIHDPSGERQITSEGYGFLPSFSADGKKLYYLVRAGPSRTFVAGQLCEAELHSSHVERLLPDFLVTHYNVSLDGKRVVFAAVDAAGKSRLWLAPLDGHSSPRQLTSLNTIQGFFGADGDVFFAAEDGEWRFIYRVKEDGTGLQKTSPIPVMFLYGVSPDGKWAAAWVGSSEAGISNAIMAFPTRGGKPVLICNGCAAAGGPARGLRPPSAGWSPDSRFFYVYLASGEMKPGKTLAFRLRSGEDLPPLPAAGISSEAEGSRLPGVEAIPMTGAFPGPNPSVYAFLRVTTQRNLYRIPLP